MEVLSPIGQPLVAPVQLAPRPVTLAGQRLGIVDNGKPNAAALLRAVEQRLVARGVLAGALWREKIATYPLPDADLAALVASCDVVLAGVGD